MPAPGRAALEWLLPLCEDRLAGDPLSQINLLDASRVLDDGRLTDRLRNRLIDRSTDWEGWVKGGKPLDQAESQRVLKTLDHLKSPELYPIFTSVLSPDLTLHRQRAADIAFELQQSPNDSQRHLAALGPSSYLHYTDPLIVLYSLQAYASLPNSSLRTRKLAELFNLASVFERRWAESPASFACSTSHLTLEERTSLADDVAELRERKGDEWNSLTAWDAIIGDLKPKEELRAGGGGWMEKFLYGRAALAAGSRGEERTEAGVKDGEEDASLARWKDAWKVGSKSRGVGDHRSGGMRGISTGPPGTASHGVDEPAWQTRSQEERDFLRPQ